LKYGLDVKIVVVLKQEVFDWDSDKQPDALKYLITGSSSFEEVIIKKKFSGVVANWEVDGLEVMLP